MTVAALRALLDAAQPDVVRPPAPRLPPRRTHPRSHTRPARNEKVNLSVNAYTAVILSMHADGYSDQQIADHLQVDREEVAQTINDNQQQAQEAAGPDGAEEDLLDWADAHTDAAVRRDAQRARTALAALRERRVADAELARITAEKTEVEQRLAQLAEREAQLKPKTGGRKPRQLRDHDPREVRTWARQQGLEVPDRGRIPKDVLAAWRNRYGTALQAVS